MLELGNIGGKMVHKLKLWIISQKDPVVSGKNFLPFLKLRNTRAVKLVFSGFQTGLSHSPFQKKSDSFRLNPKGSLSRLSPQGLVLTFIQRLVITLTLTYKHCFLLSHI